MLFLIIFVYENAGWKEYMPEFILWHFTPQHLSHWKTTSYHVRYKPSCCLYYIIQLELMTFVLYICLFGPTVFKELKHTNICINKHVHK